MTSRKSLEEQEQSSRLTSYSIENRGYYSISASWYLKDAQSVTGFVGVPRVWVHVDAVCRRCRCPRRRGEVDGQRLC